MILFQLHQLVMQKFQNHKFYQSYFYLDHNLESMRYYQLEIPLSSYLLFLSRQNLHFSFKQNLSNQLQHFHMNPCHLYQELLEYQIHKLGRSTFLMESKNQSRPHQHLIFEPSLNYGGDDDVGDVQS